MSQTRVAAAQAAEAAALLDVQICFPAASREAIVAALQRPHSVLSVDDPALNDRIKRFYAARESRMKEEHRHASVAAARQRGGASVVVALADPPSGAVAAILRRRTTLPFDVIVLGPNATAETLGGAFAAFEQSRQIHGDDLLSDQVIGLREVHATSLDPKHRKRYEQLLDRLRKAPTRSIEGIGSAKAIDVRSPKLRAPRNP